MIDDAFLRTMLKKVGLSERKSVTYLEEKAYPEKIGMYIQKKKCCISQKIDDAFLREKSMFI